METNDHSNNIERNWVGMAGIIIPDFPIPFASAYKVYTPVDLLINELV